VACNLHDRNAETELPPTASLLAKVPKTGIREERNAPESIRNRGEAGAIIVVERKEILFFTEVRQLIMRDLS
jgi:hypothetical protein